MFPFKDTLPRARPPLLSVALAVVALALWIAGPLAGGLLSLLLCLLALAIFGQSVEDILGHSRFGLLCLAIGALTFAVELLLGRSGEAALALSAAAIAAAVLGAYLALRPSGRVLTLVLMPIVAGVIELPAIALVSAWLIAQIAIGAFALDEPLASSASWFVHLLALPLALFAFRVLRSEGRPPQRPRASGAQSERLAA